MVVEYSAKNYKAIFEVVNQKGTFCAFKIRSIRFEDLELTNWRFKPTKYDDWPVVDAQTEVIAYMIEGEDLTELWQRFVGRYGVLNSDEGEFVLGSEFMTLENLFI